MNQLYGNRFRMNHHDDSASLESSLEEYTKPKRSSKSKKGSETSKKKKSIVWKYFTYNEREGLGICNICRQACTSKNNHTSHLIKHLKRWHPEILQFDNEYQKKNFKKKKDSLKYKDIEDSDEELLLNKDAYQNIKGFFEKSQVHRSKVLNFFKLDRISNKAYCQLCSQIIKMKSEKYRELKDHMNTKHPYVLEEYGDEFDGCSQKIIQNPNGNSNSTNMRDQQKIDPEKSFNFTLNMKEMNPAPISAVPVAIVKSKMEQQPNACVQVQPRQSNPGYFDSSQIKELVETIKQLENRVKGTIFISNKENKTFFEVKQNHIHCYLCDAQYSYKKKGAEPFIIHVQKIHLYKFEQKRKNEKSNKIPSIAQNEDINVAGKQVQKKLNQFRNSLPLSLDSLQVCSNEESINLLDFFLEKLKLIREITVSEGVIEKKLKFLMVMKKITQHTRNKFYESAISLWSVAHPTKQMSLKSAIYLVSQDQKLCPFIIGAIFMLEQSYEIYEEILIYLKSLQLLNDRKLLVYGSPILQRTAKQFMHIQFCNMNHGVKCSKTILINQKINSLTSVTTLDKYVHGLTEQMLTSSLDVEFLGFLLTKAFFKKVLEILPCQSRTINNIYELIISLFSSNTKIASEDDPNKFKNLKKRINLAITSNYSMNSLKQILISAEITMKIAVCFVYSLSLSTKQINSSLYEVYNCQGQQINAVEVFYDDSSSSWKCICQLGSLIGIPCPHILAILPKIDIPIYEFINPRWIADKPINKKLFPKYQNSLPTIQLSQRDFYDFLLT